MYISPHSSNSIFFTRGLLDLIINKFGGVNGVDKVYQSNIRFKNGSRIVITEKFNLLECGYYDMIVVDGFSYMSNMSRRINTLECISHKNFEKLIISNDDSRNDGTISILNRIFGGDNIHYNVKTLQELLNINKLCRKENIQNIFGDDILK